MEREEALNMEENRSFISRQHVRVACPPKCIRRRRARLPWETVPMTANPERNLCKKG
jgi:hypothetical protein